jgi:hypothetical protein
MEICWNAEQKGRRTGIASMLEQISKLISHWM